MGAEYTGYGNSTKNLKSCFFSTEGLGRFGGVAFEYAWELCDGTTDGRLGLSVGESAGPDDNRAYGRGEGGVIHAA